MMKTINPITFIQSLVRSSESLPDFATTISSQRCLLNCDSRLTLSMANPGSMRMSSWRGRNWWSLLRRLREALKRKQRKAPKNRSDHCVKHLDFDSNSFSSTAFLPWVSGMPLSQEIQNPVTEPNRGEIHAPSPLCCLLSPLVRLGWNILSRAPTVVWLISISQCGLSNFIANLCPVSH